MSSKSASIILSALFCVVVLATNVPCLRGNPLSKHQQSSNDRDDLPSFGADGSLFLTGNECGPDEKLMPGALPTCEPTCSNQKPVCAKMFFSSLDIVPCFCKAPLVRNEQTKQCVPVSECPPSTNKKIPIHKLD